MTENPLDNYSSAISEPVAIVGMACRFPDADDADNYWKNLCEGKESIHRYTDEEITALGLDPETLQKANFIPAKPKLENTDTFDAAFFGYSNREAELMDPQQRIFHECVWEALENAGYAGNQLEQSIGLFAGQGFNSYLAYNIVPSGMFHNPSETFQSWIANQSDFLTQRIAYKLNLNGPAYTLQTACSTTLVAAHLACQSLANFECDLALAGGVNLMAQELPGYFYQEHGFYSPDGRCRVFDKDANGSIFGDGQGVVVLKLLEKAIADRDTIYAVIRGTATNNDGARKASFLAPGVHGLKDTVAEALANAGVTADSIDYIESHGLGTATGDPLEVSALTQAFRETTDASGYCALGSLKPNIGHPIAAAGAAGLIKVSLAMKNGVIPPTIHFNTPNPEIAFETSPFYVNDRLKQWAATDKPRRAGINAYGIGGTNAHVILEEAPPLEERSSTPGPFLITLSARTASALKMQQAQLTAYLTEAPDTDLADLAHTLAVGRKGFEVRWATVVKTMDALLSALSENGLLPQAHDNSESLIAQCRDMHLPENERKDSLEALGQHWLSGAEVEWNQLFAGMQLARIPLPTYAFQRQRYYIQGQALPTGSGLDIAQNKYTRPELNTEYIEPDSETAAKVSAIWEDVLAVDKVGLNDDFFELGGDSLLASRVLAELPKHFEGNLPLESLLACRTVQEMVHQLTGNTVQANELSTMDQQLLNLLQSLPDEERNKLISDVEKDT